MVPLPSSSMASSIAWTKDDNLLLFLNSEAGADLDTGLEAGLVPLLLLLLLAAGQLQQAPHQLAHLTQSNKE